MFIVGFNGPPQCGKDTLAKLLADHMDSQGVHAPVIVEYLSLPLRYIAYAMVGKIYGDHETPYEEFKKTHFPQFNRTGRQLMIDVSESFLKRVYGREIMAQMLLARLARAPKNTVVLLCDTGFQLEVNPLLEAVGWSQVCIVQVQRPGVDFSNDSREWVEHPNRKMQMVIENDSDLKHLATEAGRIYGRLVNNMGWVL